MGRRADLPRVFLRTGSDVYHYSFTVDGKRYRGSTGARDAGAAAAEARKLHAEASLGRRPASRRRVGHAAASSLEVLFAEFCVWMRSKQKAASYVDKMEMHFRAHFAPRWKRVGDLGAAAIERYMAERQRERGQGGRKVSASTVYKELVTLSRFLRWAKRQGYIVEVPEFERPRVVSDYKPPDLTPEDVAEIIAELPTRKTHPKRCGVREFFTVEWSQGFRPGEAGTLLWEDVDLRQGAAGVRAPEDKARVGRVIGLSKKARAVLEELAAERDVLRGRVFAFENRRRAPDYRGSLEAAVARVNERRRKEGRPPLPRVTPHHFRHARLSELGANTRDVAALQYFAGHKHLATTDRYVRSRTERTTLMLAGIEGEVSQPAPSTVSESPPTKHHKKG